MTQREASGGQSTTVALCQLPVDDGDPEANAERIVAVLESLSGAAIAVFPEYGLTGFPERPTDAALPLDGRLVERVADAGRAVGTEVVVGALEETGDEPQNATLHLADGETTVYRKRHLWGDERGALGPGDERIVVETPLGRTGITTCFDLNFVGDSAAFTDDRVDALLVTGAWPASHLANWRLLLRARALDGLRWLVGVGRPDDRDGGEAEYAGHSAVVAPRGDVVHELGDGRAVTVVDLETEAPARARSAIPLFDGERGRPES